MCGTGGESEESMACIYNFSYFVLDSFNKMN